MPKRKITTGSLAVELCEELNKSPIEKSTTIVDYFARTRKMVCTRVLLPAEERLLPVTHILQVWLDNHKFWLYRHGGGDGGIWKTQLNY